ncbi:hypothetical protein CCACVL1_19094 [Corchorus capsularis]|uniref:Uncharacterized protein n=1 Tax=Corchorus capsularis TaxID=210143 RepID=A0A1R3HIL0_COCAP|nr:hypothetical protein CCACVL1_19094 [Corchorus capsularis]
MAYFTGSTKFVGMHSRKQDEVIGSTWDMSST